ncbi:hypothetical protein HW555_005417 [Spodoptera exigua]|uniref:Uncharacterized protein n=1 Tax=Spodoptera exigua TaxID=7107 RepID=A0A835GJV4_SPOEX|nr:hypothetical protein HW555_005417 [Spodoptera exigua]KAH9638877.1 hypothetical protein HF086_012830 [Spodoptera exigua]
MSRDVMSEQQINIKFVKEVQKYPILYNFELPSYSRRDVSDEAWREVGKAMSMTPSACRERWRNLRAVFMRTMKAPPPRVTGKKKPYYLADVMQFVVPFMRPIAMAEAAKDKQKKNQTLECKEGDNQPIEVEIEHIKVEPVEQEEDSDEWGPSSVEEEREGTPHARKQSMQDERPQQINKMAKLQPSSTVTLDSDHVKSFLNSLLPELHEMSSRQFKHFKRRVLLLIDDIMTEIPASPKRQPDDEYIM